MPVIKTFINSFLQFKINELRFYFSDFCCSTFDLNIKI